MSTKATLFPGNAYLGLEKSILGRVSSNALRTIASIGCDDILQVGDVATGFGILQTNVIGGIKLAAVSKSAGYTLTADDTTVFVDTTAGNVALVLPDPMNAGTKKIISIKKLVAANTITITTPAGNIEGVATYTLYNIGASIILQSDETNWRVLGGVPDPGNNNPTLWQFPVWIKFSKTHTDFQTAATQRILDLFTLPAGGIIHATRLKNSTAFAGTGITSYKLSLGITTETQRYATAFEGITAVSATHQQTSGVGPICENNGAGTEVKVTADSVGANLSASTAGKIEIGFLVSVCTLP